MAKKEVENVKVCQCINVKKNGSENNIMGGECLYGYDS